MARLPAPCWALVMCKRSRVRAAAVSADCLAARTAHRKIIRQPGASGERHRADCGESPRPGGPLAAPGISYHTCRCGVAGSRAVSQCGLPKVRGDPMAMTCRPLIVVTAQGAMSRSSSREGRASSPSRVRTNSVVTPPWVTAATGPAWPCRPTRKACNRAAACRADSPPAGTRSRPRAVADHRVRNASNGWSPSQFRRSRSRASG